MREIKFRGFYKHINVMEYYDTVAFLNFEEGVLYYRKLPENEPRGFNDTTDVELMQYTGLKDKNGEDIYEGDIVNLKKNFISPMDRTAVLHLDQKFIVDKNNGTYGLRKIGELIDKYPHPLYYEVDHIEVIGNIYENSELLEEAE